MRNLREMTTIEIDITNACVNQCSNCTRFCGHHKKPFFMEYDYFTKAVDSLKDYQYMVGVMGGEPTLHPQFHEFAEYIKNNRSKRIHHHFRKPSADFSAAYYAQVLDPTSKSALRSTACLQYYKHFEIINESFGFQVINDHKNTCLHQGLLVSRKDLGVADDDWEELRDNCWLQNQWSATITPKGAFFCEVAGALDMLFDGPGGWEVTPDWWMREPDDYKDQLHWCELCGACLNTPKRLSNDGRDDISPALLKKLQEVESPKVKKGKYVLLDPETYNEDDYLKFIGGNDYMEANHSKRFTELNENLLPKSFAIAFNGKLSEIDLAVVKDWVIIAGSVESAESIKELFSRIVINPGCLYVCEEEGVWLFNVISSSYTRAMTSNTVIDTIDDLLAIYPEDKIISVNTEELCVPVV